jgi:hypothetical protein
MIWTEAVKGSVNMEKAKRLGIILLVAVALVWVVINVIFARNFETARLEHIERVQSNLLRFVFTLERHITRFEEDVLAEIVHDDPMLIRTLRITEAREAMEPLGASLSALAIHHNGRAGGTGFPHFDLIMPLQSIFRHDYDPTIRLRFLADELMEIYKKIDTSKSTEDIFRLINEENRRISNELDRMAH